MKKALCVLLVMLIMIALTACGEKSPAPLDAADVKRITALDALYSSYMYVITDETAIGEIVDIYNSLTYEPLGNGEEAPNDLLMDKMYDLSFYGREADGVNGGEIAYAWISPKGYIVLDGVTYRLTSDFDSDRLSELLTQHDITKDM